MSGHGKERRRIVAYAVAAVLLPVLAYKSLWGPAGSQERVLPMQAATLTLLLVVYVYRCIRILRERRSGAAPWAGFLFLSLFVMAALMLSFTDIYRAVGLNAPVGEPSPCREPGACFYFAVTTWTTVGYGDFTPTPVARFYAALEAMVGYLFMAFFIPTMIHATTAVPGNGKESS